MKKHIVGLLALGLMSVVTYGQFNWGNWGTYQPPIDWTIGQPAPSPAQNWQTYQPPIAQYIGQPPLVPTPGQYVRAPIPVPITIRRVTSVEWTAIPNHTYRVDACDNLRANIWTPVVQTTVQGTKGLALFYVTSSNTFYRVLDLTP